jgi:hypothetical protein
MVAATISPFLSMMDFSFSDDTLMDGDIGLGRMSREGGSSTSSYGILWPQHPLTLGWPTGPWAWVVL